MEILKYGFRKQNSKYGHILHEITKSKITVNVNLLSNIIIFWRYIQNACVLYIIDFFTGISSVKNEITGDEIAIILTIQT